MDSRWPGVTEGFPLPLTWDKLLTVCEKWSPINEQLFICSESAIQPLRSSVQCTWTVGTSVKALMKSSSSTAPALSFDTTKIGENVYKCAQHTRTLQPVSNALPSNNGHVNHISLGAGISVHHTPLQLKKTKGKCGNQWTELKNCGRICRKQTIYTINMSTIQLLA